MAFIPPLIGGVVGRAIGARFAGAIGSRVAGFVAGRTGSAMLGSAAGRIATTAAPYIGMHRGAVLGQEFNQGMRKVEGQVGGSSGVSTDAMYGA